MEFKTLKDRLDFIISLKTKDIKLQDTIRILSDTKLMNSARRTVLDKLMESIISADLKICVNYDYIDENDWEYIVSNYLTPGVDNDYKAIINDIAVFIEAFKSTLDFIKENLGVNRDMEKIQIMEETIKKRKILENKILNTENQFVKNYGEVEAKNINNGKSNESVVLKKKPFAKWKDPKDFVVLLLDCFDKHITTLKIRHTQYFIFFITRYYPSIVFSYFLSKIIQQNSISKFYLCYLFSIAVRCEVIDNTQSKKVVANYVEKLYEIREEDGIRGLIFLQGFMYLCCFKEEFYVGGIKEYIQNGFESGRVGKINKKIVHVFGKKYNIKLKTQQTNLAIKHDDDGIDLLSFFAFDPPILEDIQCLFGDFYIQFIKKEN